MCCQGINYVKSGISKKAINNTSLNMSKKEDMPDDYKKSANIRPRMSDEERKKRQKEWLKSEFVCLKCGNSYKNSYKYLHNKRCL